MALKMQRREANFMNRMHLSNRVLVGALLAVPLIAPTSALGEGLIASARSSEHPLYVPLVVDVRLELDLQEKASPDDPISDRGIDRKLRRRLYLELRDEEGKRLSRSFLTGVDFAPVPGDTGRFRAVALAFLNDERLSKGGFAPWATPGTFTAVVVDPTNELTSNEFLLLLTAPEPDEEVLAARFAASLREMIPWLISDASDVPLSEDVRVLGESTSDSDYAKYARIVAAIRSLRIMRGSDPGPAAQRAAQLEDVEGAMNFLSAGHPVRDMVLLMTAVEHARTGAFTEAERLTKLLDPEKTAPSILQRAQALTREIAKEKGRVHEDARPDDRGTPE